MKIGITEIKELWSPKLGEIFFYSTATGDIIEETFTTRRHHKIVTLHNAFPNRELAKRAINLSRMERLILLWQHSNNCLFIPDWNDAEEYKWLFQYSHSENVIFISNNLTLQLTLVPFLTREQIEQFVEEYETEILKLMGVI